MIEEISSGVFRLTLMDNPAFCFSHFLVKGQKSALIHTGKRSDFPRLYELVSQLIDPASLDYILFSHFEGDESGSLNLWLEAAPNARVVTHKVGAINVKDQASRPPEVIADGESIDLKGLTLTLVTTPHFPHNWDGCVWFNPEHKVMFCSDFCCLPGADAPIDNKAVIQQVLDYQDKGGFLPYGLESLNAVAKIKDYAPEMLAPMHGRCFYGDTVPALLDAQYQHIWHKLKLGMEEAARTMPDLE